MAAYSDTAGQAAAPRVGPVGAVGAAWLLSLAFDVFLHAGVLARLYARPSPALLPAREAFARIPLGYGAFLVLTVALWWLFRRLEVRGAIAGARMGLFAGLVLWGAWDLGLYSISRLPWDLLTGWWLGQAGELALAGAALGAANAGMPRAKLFVKVTLAGAALVAATVVLQALGLAPPMETVGPGA
jgi:hypothetical protein